MASNVLVLILFIWNKRITTVKMHGEIAILNVPFVLILNSLGDVVRVSHVHNLLLMRTTTLFVSNAGTHKHTKIHTRAHLAMNNNCICWPDNEHGVRRAHTRFSLRCYLSCCCPVCCGATHLNRLWRMRLEKIWEVGVRSLARSHAHSHMHTDTKLTSHVTVNDAEQTACTYEMRMRPQHPSIQHKNMWCETGGKRKNDEEIDSLASMLHELFLFSMARLPSARSRKTLHSVNPSGENVESEKVYRYHFADEIRETCRHIEHTHTNTHAGSAR